LSAILDYFNLLKKSPKVKMSKTVSAKKPAWRRDEVTSNNDLSEKIITAAPDKKDGYIKVKTIL